MGRTQSRPDEKSKTPAEEGLSAPPSEKRFVSIRRPRHSSSKELSQVSDDQVTASVKMGDAVHVSPQIGSARGLVLEGRLLNSRLLETRPLWLYSPAQAMTGSSVLAPMCTQKLMSLLETDLDGASHTSISTESCAVNIDRFGPGRGKHHWQIQEAKEKPQDAG